MVCGFFCSMGELNPAVRPDGWSRVLEKVGLACPVATAPRLTTALKFFKSEVGPTEARVDYDLDDTPGPNPGDGLVLWDRGYLNVKAMGDIGVRVITKKVVFIQGLPSVSMKVGATALTVMPCLPHSTAMHLVMWATAALERQ